MALIVKNIDTSSHTWGGKEYAASEEYTLISRKECNDLASDDNFINATQGESPTAEFYLDSTKVTSVNTIFTLLYGTTQLFPVDEENKPIYRTSATRNNWHYSPRSLDFFTAKYGSLYNRKHDGTGIDDGTDYGDAWMEFYNSSGDALSYQQTGYESETEEEFQTRLTNNCVKTIVMFEKTESFDIFGAKLFIKNPPSTRAYLWVVAAPDIPEVYGGSKAFMGGGMNLEFFADKYEFQCDGKTVAEVNYDSENHSGRIATIVKHSAGTQIGVQIIFQYYDA